MRAILYLAMAGTMALALHMARPWGDTYVYEGVAGYVRLAAFVLWALSPLAVLAWSDGWFRPSPIAWRVFATGATGIALAGLYAYIDAGLVHPDAQGGLAFVFVPLAQWAAAVCLGVLCAVLRRVAR